MHSLGGERPNWLDAMCRRRQVSTPGIAGVAPCMSGKGDKVQARAWDKHMGQGRSLHTSAFRRIVAELLGFGIADDIYNKLVRLNAEQRAAVRAWIMSCSVAWIECATVPEANQLEKDMKAEWLPPLTRR